MKTNHIIVSVAISSVALVSGFVFAAGEYPTNPERSYVEQAAPVARTRAEVQAELAAYRKDRMTSDGWQVVGGEREDQFVGGGSPDSAIASPSRIPTLDDIKLASLYYPNTQ